MKNLKVIITSIDLLSMDERDKMFYQTFNSEDDVCAYIKKIYEQSGNDTPFESQELVIYSLNSFMTELNADTMPLSDEWVIPVFVEQSDYNDTFMDKLLEVNGDALKTQENEVKTSYISQLEKVYYDAHDEICDLIIRHGNSVKVGNSIYSVDTEQMLVMKDGKEYTDTTFGMCDLFDDIKAVIQRRENVEHIADMILDMDVERITTLMKHIGAFDGYEEIRDFGRIGGFIRDANAWGFDVNVNIENGRDYYVYGHIKDNQLKQYEIYGLLDSREQFEELLDIYYWAQIILNNDDYAQFLNEQHDEWINEKNNNK